MIPTKIKSIRKRNGQVVDFEPEKIQIAINKAFLAVTGQANAAMALTVTEQVVADLEKRFNQDTVPFVEDIQDVVENNLMEKGFFTVAKSYIIYRYEHAKQRAEVKAQVLEKIEHNDLTIIKRSGQAEKFSFKKLLNSMKWAAQGLEGALDLELVARQCETNLYENITTDEITSSLVMAARAFTERDPAYSKLATRLLWDQLAKEVIGHDVLDYSKFDEQYRQAFIVNIKEAVEIKRLDVRLLNFDLQKMASVIKPQRDDEFYYLGAQTLYDRYFVRNADTKKILEMPQMFWLRIAMGLALNEEDPETKAAEFYEIISTLRFVPSTPTLFHAGTPHPQLSSCYLTTIEDSLDHIFKCIGDNAQMSKWSGGVANDWTNLRATGAQIKGTGVESQGVIPFLKIANDTTVSINRSGRRRGATCAYLETWHYDIESFLELRRNTGDERRRTHDMNTANWIPDLFMKRVRDDGEWTLFSPEETPDLHHIYGATFERRYQYYEKMVEAGKIKLYKKIKAKDLWKKMLVMLFETGHPWITFKDPCNVRSPQDHMGVVHSSNLCTEITLNTSADETAVCNLGSVNLAKHIINGQLDEELLKETVTIAMRMLDNVIDVNFYPTVEGKNSNFKHRPVGLGIMAFQDALYLQNINFDSEKMVEFADYSMEVISYHAIMASAKLAQERGPYPSFRGSKWSRGLLPVDTLDILEQERGEKIDVSRTAKLDWTPVRQAIKEFGMRNSNCMAIAPTATIANIAGVFPSIEPIFKNIYVKSNMTGEFTVINDFLVDDLKKLGLWNQSMIDDLKGHEGSVASIDYLPQEIRDKYKEAFEISPDWLIKAAAYRGKWIDQSQAVNIFIRGTSGKVISDTYLYAWTMGLKTTYYLRSLAASSIEQSTTSLESQTTLRSSVENNSPQNVAQVVQQPIMVSSPIEEPVKTSVIDDVLANAKITLCKIDDPTCEACQ